MNREDENILEEISAEEIEVINAKSTANASEKITRISADDPTSESHPFGAENPFTKLFENIEEFKKIRFFGIAALLCSLIGIGVYPLYLESAAILLALLDLWKGSKFTRKISLSALVLAILILLSTWN